MRATACAAAAALLWCGGPGTARAADGTDPAGPPPERTRLHLSATGTVSETPDLLVATLNGENRAADPAAAQAALDRRMAAARAQATAAGPAVTARLENYQTDREQDAPDRPAAWVARQSLELRGADAGAVLALAGRLQASGLAVQDLSWILSPAKREAALARASDAALRALRRRAGEAAASLGLRPGSFEEVTLGEEALPRPRPLMRMMAARAAPAPDATPAEQDVTETASATVILLP